MILSPSASAAGCASCRRGLFIGRRVGLFASILSQVLPPKSPAPNYRGFLACFLSNFCFACLSCLLFFCFRLFSLSFLPPLSPIVYVLSRRMMFHNGQRPLRPFASVSCQRRLVIVALCYHSSCSVRHRVISAAPRHRHAAILSHPLPWDAHVGPLNEVRNGIQQTDTHRGITSPS